MPAPCCKEQCQSGLDWRERDLREFYGDNTRTSYSRSGMMTLSKGCCVAGGVGDDDEIVQKSPFSPIFSEVDSWIFC